MNELKTGGSCVHSSDLIGFSCLLLEQKASERTLAVKAQRIRFREKSEGKRDATATNQGYRARRQHLRGLRLEATLAVTIATFR